MNGFWAASGTAEHAAIAAGGAWNATYFMRRAGAGPLARRIAAATLALLFAGLALEAAAQLPVAATASEVLRRLPLLLGTLAVAVLVGYRGPRPPAPRGDASAARGRGRAGAAR